MSTDQRALSDMADELLAHVRPRYPLISRLMDRRNPFDITGARSAGLGAFWVDRAGGGWKDQIPMSQSGAGPLLIVKSLEEVATLVNDRA